MSERLYDLKNDGVQMVGYPKDLKASVQEAASQWQTFCGLSEEVKQQFAASDSQWTIGYESQQTNAQDGERKENFDYSEQGADIVEATVNNVDNVTARRFTAAVRQLGVQVTPMIEAFGQAVEEKYDIVDFADLARRSVPNAFFRFLHYPRGGEVGETIAAPHVDHSGFTFHLFETTSGCERLTFEGQWVSLPVDTEHAASFASMQTQLVTAGEIKAMAHRVLSNEECARVGRYAIVCFVALDKAPSYNKAQYGRLQQQDPGFNYTMPHDEFAKLFK